jgi:hypothetical protein
MIAFLTTPVSRAPQPSGVVAFTPRTLNVYLGNAAFLSGELLHVQKEAASMAVPEQALVLKIKVEGCLLSIVELLRGDQILCSSAGGDVVIILRAYDRETP